jgi:hypothetical protein
MIIGGKAGEVRRIAMLLEELVREFEGLKGQLPDQLIPSRAGRICCSRSRQPSRRDSIGPAGGGEPPE